MIKLMEDGMLTLKSTRSCERVQQLERSFDYRMALKSTRSCERVPRPSRCSCSTRRLNPPALASGFVAATSGVTMDELLKSTRSCERVRLAI